MQPKAKFIRNVSIVFVLCTFYYYISLDMNDFDLKGKIISGIKHYILFVIVLVWQWRKWISKPRQYNKTEKTAYRVGVPTPVKKPNATIDPKKGMFKNKSVRTKIEKYIRSH